MPTSSDHGKDTILTWLEQRDNINKIIDVGCGEGTYPTIYKEKNAVLSKAQWWGIEAWEPYIAEFELDKKYDRIFNEDVRNFDWSNVSGFDLAIFGDILEHMTKEEAQRTVDNALEYVRSVLISIPVKHMPQGAVGGNPFEIHVKDNWTHQEVLESFPHIKESRATKKIGVYWIEK
mgnify:CR=1 FL=1